jgi:flagellar motor protein MotB
MTAAGWGQEWPVADDRTEDERAKNRRAEIIEKQTRPSGSRLILELQIN